MFRALYLNHRSRCTFTEGTWPHFASTWEKKPGISLPPCSWHLPLHPQRTAASSAGPWRSPGPWVLLLLPCALQEVQRVSWYSFPCTLITFPCCTQSWCGWHGSVLEPEEKKPRGHLRHWVSSKGVPAGGHGDIRRHPQTMHWGTRWSKTEAPEGVQPAAGQREVNVHPNHPQAGMPKGLAGAGRRRRPVRCWKGPPASWATAASWGGRELAAKAAL